MAHESGTKTKRPTNLHWKVAVERIAGVKRRTAAAIRQAPGTATGVSYEINREIITLQRAIQSYLTDNRPSSRCGSMTLIITADNCLDIRFNADGKEVTGRTSDGCVVIGRDGYVKTLSMPASLQ